MKPEDIHWLDEEQSEEPEESREEEPVEEESAPEEVKPVRSRRRRSGKAFLWVLLILAALAAAFYFSGVYEKLFGNEGAKTLSSTTEPISYTADSYTRIRPFGGLALQMSENGIKAYTSDGSIVWDYPYTMSSPTLCTAENYAAVADLGSHSIMLFDSKGLVSTITAEYPIQYCTVNRTGYMAVILESGDGHTLAVYDKDGGVLVRRITYSDQDGIPMTIAINDDASGMATAYAIYTESTLRSAVTLFNLTDTAADSIDRIAGNYNYMDTLVTDLCYMGDTLFVVGDNQLAGIRTSGNTAEEWTETLSFQITSLGFGEDYLALHLGNGLIGVAGEPKADFLVIGKDGTHRVERKLADFRSLLVSDNTVVVQDGFDYQALDAQGDLLWSYRAENGMQLYALTNKLALGNTGSALQFFRVITEDEEVNS